MLSRIAKGVAVGLAVGVLGVAVSLTPFGLNVAEDFGLTILFRLRGHRKPPPEVVVVSIDQESADALDLPGGGKKWPRFVYADLARTLANHGAKFIAFDLFFEDPEDVTGDRAFAQALRDAGNVILCERIQSEELSVQDHQGGPGAVIEITRRIAPLPLFAEAAVASAPYPLPKMHRPVSRDWTFQTATEHGETPTLPVVAFQWFALPVYPEFLRILEMVYPHQASELPRSGEEFARSRGIKGMVQEIRALVEEDPAAEKRLLAALDRSPTRPGDARQRRIVRSLIRVYAGGVRKFLNFYGPSRTVTTIPSYRVLQLGQRGSAVFAREIEGKAVFVGYSEARQLAQKDGFYTVYTSQKGVDVSGVEIQATSFANLLEDMTVRPTPLGWQVAGLLLWGAVAGGLVFAFRPVVSFPAMAAVSLAYLGFAVHRFLSAGAWYPVVIPLLLQGPMVLGVSIVWNYVELSRERSNFRRAFKYYLPAGLVEELAREYNGSPIGSQLVNGICLATDAEHYTTLAESMDPKALAEFMNRYYEAVFDPVRRHGGMVSNVVGDSMLALWVTTGKSAPPVREACLAAVEIADAMREFRRSLDGIRLPTRIGVHTGEILLGNLGAGEHFEYRPVGDIVNTATRIEGLNKHLGTRILVSQDVLPMAEQFLARDLGYFLLAGKSKPVHIYELVALREQTSPRQEAYCASFAGAMEQFRRQAWQEASSKFQETLRIRDNDGPSLFFWHLCARFVQDPPGEAWDGVVHVEQK
ncbi:MAG: CHASE2 domain-containing protein [Verrucomicrobiota bacterium]